MGTNFSRNVIKALMVTFALAFGMSGCEKDDSFTSIVSGRAEFPPQFSGPLGAVPVSNSSFIVRDFDRKPADDVVATGTTDASGNYVATVPTSSAVAVIITGKPSAAALGSVRVSGLIDVRDGSVEKNFNGVTDVACEAGVSAILDGSVPAVEMDRDRIGRLEAGAPTVIEQLGTNFADSASVSAAAKRLRELTDNGAHTING